MSAGGIGEFQNRTLICSVLFIDIAEYSRQPVVEQGRLKDRLNTLLSESLRGVAINDRIILDTGDGAAISFIGDPEDALFVATGLRDAIASQPESGESQLATRMGINLGPVRLVKDINGQPNIIGDGINVAQRVMTFARPGQVLVSRSYYEVVSRLSDESSKLFTYEGSRADKHIREHEVYAVGAIPEVRKRLEETHLNADWRMPEQTGRLGRARRIMKTVADRLFENPRLATLSAAAVILAVALGARIYRGDTSPDDVTSKTSPAIEQTSVAESAGPAPPQTAPIAAPPPVAASAPAPDIVTPKEEAKASAPEQAKAKPREPALAPRARGAAPTPPSPQKQVRAEPDATPGEPAPAPPPRAGPAFVSFAISPWGEVYVDGKLAGVSPPLQELELASGRHRIEIRNSASDPYAQTVNAKPGERIRIKHKFN